MKKVVCIVCVAAMLITLAAGCGGGGKKEASQTARDDVIISLLDEPFSICNMMSPQTVAQLVSRQMAEPLVLSDKTGVNVSPHLASQWEFNAAGDEIVFTLRDDVYFHDGEKMTADDVVFSYMENLRIGVMETTIAYYDRMEKIDDTHVRLYLTLPFPAIMACVGASDCGIVSSKSYQADPDAFSRAPIGSGPYKFLEWKSGESITLVANENYWGGAPSIKKVVFKMFTDENAASLALQNGEIDFCFNPPPMDKDRIENTDGLTWLSDTGLNNCWIFFGYHEDSHFHDENVRLAIAYAIDKDAVTLGATDGLGYVSRSSIFGDWWGYSHPGYQAPQNDLDKAREYLARSPYPNGFDVEVVTTNNASYYRFWEIIQDMLSEIGINIILSKIDSGTWDTEIFWEGDYEFNGWLCDMSFPDFCDHVPLWRTGAFLNGGLMHDPYVDELLDAQELIPDSSERLQIIRDVNAYMTDHGYLIPLYTYPNFAAFNSNLRGIEVATMNNNYKINQWSWAG